MNQWFFLAMLIPLHANSVRRLHDGNARTLLGKLASLRVISVPSYSDLAGELRVSRYSQVSQALLPEKGARYSVATTQPLNHHNHSQSDQIQQKPALRQGNMVHQTPLFARHEHRLFHLPTINSYTAPNRNSTPGFSNEGPLVELLILIAGLKRVCVGTYVQVVPSRVLEISVLNWCAESTTVLAIHLQYIHTVHTTFALLPPVAMHCDLEPRSLEIRF